MRQGHAQSRLIHTSIDGLKPLDVKDDDPELRRPSQEEIAQTKERTQAALDKLLNGMRFFMAIVIGNSHDL